MRDDVLHRHDIVRVDARARDCVEDVASEASRARIRAWIEAERPFVVRRQATGPVDGDTVALGLPLPPVEGKGRIGLTLPWRMIVSVAAPPALAEVIDHMPAHWHVALVQLQRRSEPIGIAFRVFGSAAWQMLTGLAYVGVASDVDLLWRPANGTQLCDGVALIERWEREFDIRADGEIVFPDDNAVAWREWLGRERHAHVLAKRRAGPLLRTPAELLQALDRADQAVLCVE